MGKKYVFCTTGLDIQVYTLRIAGPGPSISVLRCNDPDRYRGASRRGPCSTRGHSGRTPRCLLFGDDDAASRVLI